MAAVVLAAVGEVIAACVPVHNMVADRDVDCRGTTPDDVCLRVAEAGVRGLQLESADPTHERYPVISVIYHPLCGTPRALRCWSVKADSDNGPAVEVVEWPDGSIQVN